jgi:hypothetical protein
MAQDSVRLDLRTIQLEADGCCCGELALLAFDAPGKVMADPAGLRAYGGGPTWCFVSLGSLTLEEADSLAAELPSWCQSRGIVCFGSREDHVTHDAGGFQLLHACLCFLVGCCQPADRLFPVPLAVTSCLREYGLSWDDHRFCLEPCPSWQWSDVSSLQVFLSWARERLLFVSLAGQLPSFDGLQRWVFGSVTVVDELCHQVGGRVDETFFSSLALQSLQRDRCLVSDGGFVPHVYGVDGVTRTVYVEDEDALD